jgi:hypothetical protein
MHDKFMANCPHELRPGIKVCLHCLHEARRSAARRRLRVLLMSGGALGVVLVLVAGAQAGLQYIRANQPAPTRTDAAAAAGADAAVPSTIASAPPATRATIPSAAPALHTVPMMPIVPVVPEGLTELPNGVRMVRAGDTVVVDFDRPMLRTRRTEKFEDIIRSTLVQVYGAQVDSILSRIPRGSLVQVQDLFAELPTTGLRISLPAGGALALWPQTRMRDDGPLVVAYRAIVMR